MKTQVEARWKRRKDQRPAEIMAAALDCFKERGFSATKLDDVAAQAGVTKGTLYLYFRSKEDIFKAVVENFLATNVLPLAAVDDESRPTSELLADYMEKFVSDVFDTPKSVLPKIIITESGNFPDLAKFYYDTIVTQGMRLLAALLRRGIERGEFRAIDVDHAVFSVFGPLLMTLIWKHTFEVHAGKPLDAKAICRAHLDLLLHGLTKNTGSLS